MVVLVVKVVAVVLVVEVVVVNVVIGFTMLLIRVKVALAGPVATIENCPVTFGL